MRDNPADTDVSPVPLADGLAALNELHHCPLLNMRRAPILAGFCVNTGFASLESQFCPLAFFRLRQIHYLLLNQVFSLWGIPKEMDLVL